MRNTDAQTVAKQAVKEVFYLLGVDVDDPKQVEAFRRDIRFAGDLRRQVAKGVGAILVALVGGAITYIWSRFKT
jgi:hypothetical protein